METNLMEMKSVTIEDLTDFFCENIKIYEKL